MTSYDIEVCVDCAMMIANGDDSGIDNTDAWYHAVMAKGMLRFDVAMSCGDDCAGYFSKSACDYCGSRLAGDRHPAVLFGE